MRRCDRHSEHVILEFADVLVSQERWTDEKQSFKASTNVAFMCPNDMVSGHCQGSIWLMMSNTKCHPRIISRLIMIHVDMEILGAAKWGSK